VLQRASVPIENVFKALRKMRQASVVLTVLAVAAAGQAVKDRYSSNLIGNWTWLAGHLISYTVFLPGTTTELPTLFDAGGTVDYSTSKGYLVGGALFSGYFSNMIYELDFKTITWNRLTPYGASSTIPDVFGPRGVPLPVEQSRPTGRMKAASWSVNGLVYLYGGTFNFWELFNDLWVYNISSSQWTWINGEYSNGTMNQSSVSIVGKYGRGVPQAQVWPPGRFSSPSWAYGQNSNISLFFIGGFGIFNDSTQKFFNNSWSKLGHDIWRYEIQTGYWYWVGGQSTSAPGMNLTSTGSPNNYPPSIVTSSLACSTRDGNLWFINSKTYNPYAYLWFFNTSILTWSLVYQMQTTLEYRISNMNDGGLIMVGSDFLFVYEISFDYTKATNALYYYYIPTKKWNWVSGNSTGAAVTDIGGYFPYSVGVSYMLNLPPALSQFVAFSFDNKLVIAGGLAGTSSVEWHDSTFLFEICDSNSMFNGTCIHCQPWEIGTAGVKALQKCISSCSYGKVLQADTCVDCPQGKFAYNGHCTNCPAGSYAPSLGMSSCLSCQSGFFSSTAGTTWCTSCSPGFYSSSMGSSMCSSCSDGLYSGSNASICDPCELGKIGTVNHSTCIACPLNAITLKSASLSIQDCLCGINYYGSSFLGKNCSLCSNDQGVDCQRVNINRPEIQAGFFRNPVNENSAFKCVPSDACLGASEFETTTSCAHGYTGNLCGDCIAGEFYRQGIICASCPSKTSHILTWIAVIVVALIALWVAARKVDHFSSELKILIFWIQILSLYPSMSSSWPPSLRSFLQLLSGVNFDIQITSPGKVS
jgi:hypothetical protein